MEKGRVTSVLAAFLVLSGLILITLQPDQEGSERYPVKFYTLEEGFETAKRENRTVLIYIHSDRCHVCRAFMEDLSKYDDLREAIERFVVVKVDFDSERLLAMKFGATGTPEYHIFRPDGTRLKFDNRSLIYIGYSNTPDSETARKSLISFLNFAYQQYMEVRS